MQFTRAKVLGILVSATLFSSCGSGSVQLSGSLPQEDPTLQGASLQFSTSLYPLVVEHCSSCHDQTQAPFFAIQNDPLTSYNNIVDGQYLDATSPENSKLVLKVAGNHNCWSGNCKNDANALLDQIKPWVTALAPADTGTKTGTTADLPKIITAEKVIPATGGTTAGNIITFPLAGLGTGVPADASLQITVKQFDATNYSITKMQIKSSVALSMTSLSVILNGKEVPNDTFTLVDYSLTAFISNNVYKDVSPATDIALMGYNGGSGAGSDKLRIGFTTLANFDPSKLQFQTFLSVVQNSCGSCHMNQIGATPGFGRYTTAAEFLNVPSAGGKKLLVPKDSANSTIYTYSAPGSPSVMPKSGIQVPIYTAFKTYIDSL